MAHESNVQRQIISYLKKKGVWSIKMSLTSENGWPDLLCIGYNHIFFVEVKSPGEKPSKLQLFIHSKIRECGFDVLVADDKQKIIDYIEELKNEREKQN